ncbi:CinA family protein [Muricoccus aerilatus]|uniref:CinA family protein n=1 Tax=Muricoccus aerilatus TaxID=452982 RepID=UPI0005C1744D|nr:nicotinamide-nucleotide amidohydrolase family protein [Roseomonas aerilata]
MPEAGYEAAAGLLELLRAHGLTIATAESCTGGLVAGALTAVPGSSDAVVGGFVTYSNGMKTRMLGVPEEVLASVGAVSEACARRMAEGAARESGADIGVSTTGIAGPGGGSAEKPVGLVYIGAARRDGRSEVQRHVFPGDRAAVRAATVEAALRLAAEMARA